MSVATNKWTKWTSSAGPRQTKQVNEALNALNWHGKGRVQVTDHGRYVIHQPFSNPSEAVQKALAEIGETFGYSITRENFKDVIAACNLAIESTPMPVEDSRTTAAERIQLAKDRKEADEKRAADAKKHAAEVEKHVAELKAKYPWAKPADTMVRGRKISGHARAAANIKEELRRTFPGIDFSVKSDSFSMGDSVDVKWTNGPTSKEVDAVIGKYQYGHFDGMVDMYEDDRSAYGDAVESVLGRSKYVHSSRDYDRADYEYVARKLCEIQGVEYEGSDTRNVFGDGDCEWLSSHVNAMFSECSFPAGAKITGIKHTPPDHPSLKPYVIAFDAPVPVAADPASSSSGDGMGYPCHVEKHRHTKKGKDMWIVVLNNRVSSDEFEKLRSLCREDGGWYSRQWGKTPGGFAFSSSTDAESFAAKIN